MRLPDDTAIDAEVDLNLADDGFFLRARLNVSIPGVDRAVAKAIVEDAETTCPYSKALAKSIDVDVNLI